MDNILKALGKVVCSDESWIHVYDKNKYVGLSSKSTFFFVQNLTLFIS